MHVFCQVLQESVPDILMDASAAGVVVASLDEILSTEHTTDDPRDLMSRVLEVVLLHPIVSSRFRRYIISEGIRGSEPTQNDPSLQELFNVLRLVKNSIVLKNPTTLDDVAAEVYSQPNTGVKSEDVPSPTQPRRKAK